MKNFLLLILFTLVSPAAAADGINLPEYQTTSLDNGLTLQVMRHSTVPLVAFELWIDAGAVYDPEGQEGVASLTAGALRKGSGSLSADEFALAVDALGAEFSAAAGRDFTRVRMNLLAKDFEAGLKLLADAVLRPAFDEEEITKMAARMGEGVAQSKDNPRNVLGNYHNAFFYGDHTYGKPPGGTEVSLGALGVDQVKAFYANNYGADRAILTVVGDIDETQALTAVSRAFAGMARAKGPKISVPPVNAPQSQRVLLVNKNDTPQTWFQIGGLGPGFKDPEYAASELVRTVFGGRFTSWLNTKLRIETGLTYGARYSFTRAKVPGAASIMSFTATETTKEAMDLAMAQLERLHRDGLSEEELASAKAYLKGQSAYDYETAEDLALIVTRLGFYGVSREHVDTLFQRVNAVTLEDCRSVIDHYFAKNNLVITAIGVAEEIKPILESYGSLTVRENTEPGFK